MNQEKFDQKEQELSLNYSNQKIEYIKFWNISENYFAFEEQETMTLNGGFEISFESGKILSLGWNEEMMVYENYDVKYESKFSNNESWQLSEEDNFLIENLKGKEIISISSKWTWYEDFDSNVKFIPLQIIFQLPDNKNLMIATVEFKYDIINDKIHDLRFDPEGKLVITMNENYKIRG